MNRLLLAAALLALPSGQGGAQTRVPDAPTCASCTIALRKLATLGTFDGPGALPASSVIRVDGGARYWILHPPDLPLVFDSLGRVVATGFRKGSGPGEFEGAAAPIPLPGDSTLAVDENATIVLGPDLRYTRKVTSRQRIHHATPLHWPDRVFVNGYARARAPGFEPLALASFAGDIQTIVKAFGTHPGEPMPDPLSIRRPIARAGDRVWVAEETRYRLTEWSADGAILRVLERNPDWFDSKRTDWGGPDKPPRENIAAISVDERGYIWVFASVAAPTWREAWPKLPPGTREISGDRIRREKMYRTTIEVIDPATERVVARTTRSEFIKAAFRGGKAAVYRVDDDGVPYYDIVALTLEGLPKR